MSRHRPAAARADAPDAGAMAALDVASNLYMVSSLPWTRAMLGRALAILPADDPSRRSVGFLDAFTRLLAGDPSGEQVVAQTIRSMTSHKEPVDSGWAWTTSTFAINALKLLEDLQSATELFEREFGRAVDAGAPLTMTALAVVYGDALWRIGHAAEAVELVERAIALSDRPVMLWSELALAVSLTELGRDDQARPHIAAVSSATAHIGPEYSAAPTLWMCVIDGRRLLGEGDSEQASAVMVRAGEIARSTGWRHPLIVPWAGVGIDAHLAAGRVDRARQLIEELDKLSRPLRCRWPRAIVILGRDQLAGVRGEPEHADRLFHRALEMFAEVPMPIFHAEALITYGSHLRRSGRPRDAREPLARALALCEPGNAERVGRIARAELAACGGRRRRRHDDSHELTAQEQRVAHLAAQGRTNAQIAAALSLSPKTIGHYLERIYSKLDIHSRHQLAARLRGDPEL